MYSKYQNIFHSTKLISLENELDEMIKLYEKNSFPKSFLLSGKKGIGKFTLVFHFLNYVYSKEENTKYDFKENLINTKSNFYNSILNQTCLDVIFLQAEEGKNIKIDDVRDLKEIISRSSLTNNPRFIIIDEVEFLNINSANALLKTLEEPSQNNFFILINNQQANLLETISSRCLKSNIFLNFDQRKKITDHLITTNEVKLVINDSPELSPGLLLTYNDLATKLKIDLKDPINLKLFKLLHAFKKDKNKHSISMAIFLIDQFFYYLVKERMNKIEFLLNIKIDIIKKINDFIFYNININSVLNSIELELKHAK